MLWYLVHILNQLVRGHSGTDCWGPDPVWAEWPLPHSPALSMSLLSQGGHAKLLMIIFLWAFKLERFTLQVTKAEFFYYYAEDMWFMPCGLLTKEELEVCRVFVLENAILLQETVLTASSRNAFWFCQEGNEFTPKENTVWTVKESTVWTQYVWDRDD